MTRNFKIGLSLFLNELKTIGALDSYINAYCSYHNVNSPILMCDNLWTAITIRKQPLIFSLSTNIMAASPEQIYTFLVYNFSDYMISFYWAYTEHGASYWGSVRQKLLDTLRTKKT